MADMTFTNSKVSGQISDQQLYQSRINIKDTVPFDALAEETADNLKQNANAVTSILKEASSVIKTHLTAGERVVLDDFCRIEIVAHGSFQYEDQAWGEGNDNAIAVAIVPCAELKSALVGITPTNTLSKVTIQLNGAQDGSTYEQNTLVKGHTLLAQGKNMTIVEGRDDEGSTSSRAKMSTRPRSSPIRQVPSTPRSRTTSPSAKATRSRFVDAPGSVLTARS